MKTKEIAKKYDLNASEFDQWLKQSGHPYKSGITGMTVEDTVDQGELVRRFNQYLAEEKARRAQEQAQAESAITMYGVHSL